ncbi:protein-glutamate methylesterase/protein-glutamine glutaminase [Gorillibacterium massiliense]|uniref:protein-glutamate methylesterase/protein-glutamine glutaminase n=1 Tax=Gorillibacterium massiliense TaxID=1280390 RepID=UPI0004B534D5|nr:chemotaxis response regulator protein-glutamate methylesterase [Gorillibacterium massiliense]
MTSRKRTRVLVVDDSIFVREVIRRGISTDPQIEVIAVAGDPFEARDLILECHPDVITCDVEMPRMNGIEFVRRLLPQYRVPIIMVSSVSAAVFDAMSAGAVDFVVKPDIRSAEGIEPFIRELIGKIRTAAIAKVEPQTTASVQSGLKDANHGGKDKIIAIGASTGGTEAIFNILQQLPPSTPGIAIVQHIPPVFSRMFAERINNQTALRTKEAQNGDYLETGTVLIAPGDRHMRVKRVGDRFKVETFEGDRRNGHCPSVDILFESVAKEAGSRGIGIILTGMGYDGAQGLLAMRRKGGRTIGQDSSTSVVYGMPKVAFELGAVEKQAPLALISHVLVSILKDE